VDISIVLGPFHEPPPGGFGAVEKVWWSLAQELSRLGHRVRVVAKGRSCAAGGVPVRAMRGFNASGVLPVDLAKDLIYAMQVLIALPRSDIVVTNSFWLPVVLAPFKRRIGRIVVHVGRFPKGQMWLYRGADLLHTVSSPVAAAIERECPALRERVAVEAYPIDVHTFAPAADEGRDTGEILYVGRIHPEKGLELLVRAFREVHAREPQARLALVGPWESRAGGGGIAFLRRLRELAAGLPVTFEPPIADEARLAARYRAAAIFCYPSVAERGETFGRSLLEAMACGIPSVASALGCFADFFRHGEDGLVFDHRAPDAVDRLSGTLLALLLDRAAAAGMGAHARERALRFSLEAIAGDYVRMLESVVHKPPGPAGGN
jgi:glycosyltransferase involved in cell wall biosynthesis